MSNTLTDLIDTLIMPMALSVLRESCVMPALVYRDFSNEVAMQNDTIRIPKPQDMGTADTFSSTTGSSSTDLDDPYVDVKADQWKYKQFQMNDKEMRESMVSGILPSAMESAMKALANSMDLSLLGLYTDIPYHYGTPGTTPDESADIIGVRKVLEDNLAPRQDRRLVFDTSAEAEFLDLYEKVNETGTTAALREASLGRLFGFETYSDQLINNHSKGTLAAANSIATKAIYATGTKTITLDDSSGGTLTGTLLAGDKFTIAGDTQVYHVQEAAEAASDEIEISIYPGIQVATTDGAVVTLKDDWTPNLAFHRDAFALVVRPLGSPAENNSATISVQSDPVTGMPLRLTTWYDPKYSTSYWKFDVLYGVKTLRSELAAVLFG